MKPRGASGYSLVELVILFVVLFIACGFIAVNWTLFMGSPPQPREETEEYSAALIRMAIQRYAAESREMGREPTYPLRLDGADPGAKAGAAEPLFTNIVPDGIRSSWVKIGANRYVFGSGGAGDRRDKDVYHYSPHTGRFDKGPDPEVGAARSA